MGEGEKRKIPYEPPRIIDLVTGTAYAQQTMDTQTSEGTNCRNGSVASSYCKNGSVAGAGKCTNGSAAGSSHCTNGGSPGAHCMHGSTAYGGKCQAGSVASYKCFQGSAPGKG